ncbi:MAG: ribonuclease III [Planctomycetes bacterium]|nr:ribonuclease III [Planctomycetota bacterium]
MQDVLNYSFKNQELLEQALRHSSAKTETRACNERLEFLGDALLGMLVSEMLYREFPAMNEGELSLIKSEVVSRLTLAELAKKIELAQWIEVGKGLKEKDGLPDSILANVMEALFGAVYLDGGLVPLKEIIFRMFAGKIEEVVRREHEVNHKASLQHYAQKELGLMPLYRVVKETGPRHDPVFTVMVKIGDTEYGPGEGKTKKEAEQAAAQVALAELKI